MRLRGVARHHSDFDRAIFRACRYSIVMESIQTAKPCFLALAPWRELSQEINDSTPGRSAYEDAREAIFQEIVHHPGYILESVNYMANGGWDRSVLQDLVRRGHMHRSNHKAIHTRCVQALREAGQEPIEAPSSIDDKVFPTVFQYPGVHVASSFCTYWALLKGLNMALIGLEAKLSAIESTRQTAHEQMTPVQLLTAGNMSISRESLSSVVVAESTSPQDAQSVALTSNTNAIAREEGGITLPDRTSSSPVTDLDVGTRSSESPTPAPTSPTEYPTMSSSDTAKRRQMYMAENKHCAHQICKSVECISTSAFMGPIFLIFSLKTIGRMLDNPQEKEWILRKMALLGQTWGIAKNEADGAREENEVRGNYGAAVRGSPRDRDASGSKGKPNRVFRAWSTDCPTNQHGLG